jgi:predicted dehydrogenase
MRALLVGAGGMGRAWAKNLSANSSTEIAGWIDVRDGAAAGAAEELGLSVQYTGTDVETALREVAPDFVVDVTPPEVHHDVTLASLAAGIPVLGEKPMAWTIEQAKAMVRAADQAGKLYMVSQSRRYNGPAMAYQELIAQNLGRLGILNADFYIGAHFGGFRDDMEGPLILDMAIHTFDMARMLSGKDCVSVYAEEFNPHWSWYKGDSSAVCLFEMEDGLRFDYRGSWCAEGCMTSWECEWRAVGERGTAKWDGNDQISGEVVAKTAGFHSECSPISAAPKAQKYGIEGSLEDFVEALATGVKPRNGECHDNIKSFAMVMAAHESAKRRERVSIAELMG